MSTEFYWDKEKKELIFTRYAGGIPEEGKDLKYIFNGVDNLVKFFKEKDETIIYSEYDIPYTVASMKSEIIRRGAILIEVIGCVDSS